MNSMPFAGFAVAGFLDTDAAPISYSQATSTCGALVGDPAQIEGRFRQLTTAGNRAFHAGDDAEALRLSSEALVQAERLFDVASADGASFEAALEAPMAHNIASHNAAEVLRRQKDYARAFGFESGALRRLVVVAKDPSNPLLLRVSCIRHVRYALASLRCHLEAAADGGATLLPAKRRELVGLLAQARATADTLGKVTQHLLSPCEVDTDQQPLRITAALLKIAQPAIVAMLAKTEALVGVVPGPDHCRGSQPVAS